MDEGVYEEPIILTLRGSEAIYENTRNGRNPGERKWTVSSLQSVQKPSRITNSVILVGIAISILLSVTSLAVLTQIKLKFEGDLSKLNQLLDDLCKVTEFSQYRPEIENVVNGTENGTGVEVADVMMNVTSAKRGLCKIFYVDKCFLLLTINSSITLAEGRAHCRDVGGALANIYNIEHLKLVEGLMKDTMEKGSKLMKSWTGMTFDSEVLLPSPCDFTLTLPEISLYKITVESSLTEKKNHVVKRSSSTFLSQVVDRKSSQFCSSVYWYRPIPNHNVHQTWIF